MTTPPPETIDADSLALECLNLHYDRFDTLGMEESSLPRDINRAGQTYVAQAVALGSIPRLDDPDVEVDEDKVQAYAARLLAGNLPPRIVLNRRLRVIDGWHRALAALAAGRATILAWVPAVGGAPA